MGERERGKIVSWPHDAGARDALDQAIDRAVRDIMSVDAARAFRARVFARLERPERSWAWMRMATVGAVAALIAALLLIRDPSPADPIGEVVHKPVIQQPGAAPVTPAPESATPREQVSRPILAEGRPSRPRPPAPATQQIARGVVTAAVAEDEPAVHIPALDPIEPIGVTPFEVKPISTPAIVIEPLPGADGQLAPGAANDIRRDR